MYIQKCLLLTNGNCGGVSKVVGQLEFFLKSREDIEKQLKKEKEELKNLN